MAVSNFQDVVVLNSNTLSINGERLVIGSAAGSKSIVFAQDTGLASAMHLVASNPTAQRTAVLPDANGTIGLLTNVSAGTTAISNGQIVFSNSNFVFGVNGSTITAGLSTALRQEIGLYQVQGLAATSNQISTTITASSVSSDSQTKERVGAIRASIFYPINITFIDPRVTQGYDLSASLSSNASLSLSASYTWWCGLYTFSGSTAGVVSSVSSSASTSGSSTFQIIQSTFLPYFNNITWIVTPGEYLFFSGMKEKYSASISIATGTVTLQAVIRFNGMGLQPELVTYSVPYWTNGTVTGSATSYHLTDLVNSSANVGTLLGANHIARLIGS